MSCYEKERKKRKEKTQITKENDHDVSDAKKNRRRETQQTTKIDVEKQAVCLSVRSVRPVCSMYKMEFVSFL